jgi:hypothetical protein
MTYVIDAKTASGAASQLKRAIQDEITRVFGQDDPSVLDVKRQAVDIGYGDRRKGWMVTWENGPFEWAIIGTLGGAIWNEELGRNPYRNNGRAVVPTFSFPTSGIDIRARWVAEAKNSYAVVFYPQS